MDREISFVGISFAPQKERRAPSREVKGANFFKDDDSASLCADLNNFVARKLVSFG